MYEQNVLSGHNKVIQAHVQSRATGIEDKGHHVLRAVVVGARPDLRIAPEVHDDRCPWGLVRSGRQAGQRAPGDLSGEGVEVCRVVISCGELSELRGETRRKNDQTRRNAGTWQHPGAVGPRCIPDAV